MASPPAPAAQGALGSVEKAVDVLFHLHGEPGARGVSAIGRALGLPKSTTHRLLAALVRRGLVERDDTGRYRPGIGLVALGLGVLDREPLVAAARPVLEREADALGETAFLVAARAGRLVVLDKAEGQGFLRAAPRIGASVPAHATAVGKLHLAFGAGSVAAPELERFSDATLTSRRALEREVARVAARGFAENRDEWIPGLSVVAAPVRSSREARPLLGALAVAMPSQRFEVHGAEALRRRTLAAARRIEARLAGTAP